MSSKKRFLGFLTIILRHQFSSRTSKKQPPTMAAAEPCGRAGPEEMEEEEEEKEREEVVRILHISDTHK